VHGDAESPVLCAVLREEDEEQRQAGLDPHLDGAAEKNYTASEDSPFCRSVQLNPRFYICHLFLVAA
jgi:hypothetical protein